MFTKRIFLKNISVTKNKSLEIHLAHAVTDEDHVAKFGTFFDFDVNFNWKRKCDHAGVYFDIQLFGFFFETNLSDDRHWNYETNTYESYGQ